MAVIIKSGFIGITRGLGFFRCFLAVQLLLELVAVCEWFLSLIHVLETSWLLSFCHGLVSAVLVPVLRFGKRLSRKLSTGFNFE